MRCPSCHDEYEAHVTHCAACHVPLVAGDADPGDSDADGPATAGVASRVPDAPWDARLGLFHPAAAARVEALLGRQGIEHTVVERDDAVEIRVDRADRDDVRTELTLNWDEVVDHLEDDAVALPEGSAPGWYDAPRGGHIDRAGRLVVDPDDNEEWETSRILGPGLLAAGGVVGVTGWWVLDSGALVALGIGLLLLGLFSPR